jgi:alpha-beta hydrolase superfamily lysophospholipase
MAILDFAKDLLMNMSGYGSRQDKIGQVRFAISRICSSYLSSLASRISNLMSLQIPIFFVAHSMGGLVVKKV